MKIFLAIATAVALATMFVAHADDKKTSSSSSQMTSKDKLEALFKKKKAIRNEMVQLQNLATDWDKKVAEANASPGSVAFQKKGTYEAEARGCRERIVLLREEIADIDLEITAAANQ
jgi:hypothetical protein